MSQVDFNVTQKEHETILAIAYRAARLIEPGGPKLDLLSLTMDLEATHRNGCPLKLEALLAADDSNFIHDITGIMSCLDRKTGTLTRSFLPRFAMSQKERESYTLAGADL